MQNVLDVEQARGEVAGVIVALGGQTPLKLSAALDAGLVMGTSPASIDLAEDRERWNGLCEKLRIPQAAGGTATSLEEALAIASKVGYPVLVRPSYVLGGRAMEIAYGEEDLERAMGAMTASGSLGREGGLSAERPVLVDKFLEDAIEVDVDAVRDADGETLIGAVMEHVEEAGVHSGDSACVVPPPTLSPSVVRTIGAHTRDIADALEVKGPLNVQYAVQRNAEGVSSVFVIEANPRASRTVPFVSKATGVPLAKVAARVMAGATLAELRAEGLLKPPVTGYVSVKEAVLPFDRFPDADSLLGPRCARRARSWASTTASGWPLPRASSPPATTWRKVARCSSRWPTGTSPPAWKRRRALSKPASALRRPRGRRPTCNRPGCRWPPWWPRWRRAPAGCRASASAGPSGR